MQANALINHRRNKSGEHKRKEDILLYLNVSRENSVERGVQVNSKELCNSFSLLVAQIRKTIRHVATEAGIGAPGLVEEPSCRLVRMCGSIAVWSPQNRSTSLCRPKYVHSTGLVESHVNEVWSNTQVDTPPPHESLIPLAL